MFPLQTQCLALALTSTGVALSVVVNRLLNGWANASCFGSMSEAAITIIGVILATVSFDMYRFGPAASHSYSTLYDHYKNVRRVLYHGRRVIQDEEKSYATARKTQERILLQILNDAKKTKHGKDNGLNQIRTAADFRSKVPLSTYEQIAPYVDRVLRGEKDVLFEGTPVYIGTTSGTTGKYKCFPKNEKFFKASVDYLLYKPFCIVYSAFPSVALKKVLTIQTFHVPTKLESGYRQGPLSGAFAAYRSYYVLPQDGYFLTTADASTYAGLLYGLKERDVGIITSLFSTATLVFFQKMETNWKDLCDDIQLGRIRDDFGIPPDKLKSLRSQFSADPRRAEELRREFRKGFYGIAARIWPGCKITIMIATGVFKSAADILRENYLNGIPNCSRFHGGTEGGYGFVDFRSFPPDPVYNMMAILNFIELLPVEDESTKQETILPCEAEIGKQYEIVVTTSEGLHRYKTDDIITVVGFYHETPQYKFTRRFGDVLYLNNEKTPVHVVETALFETLRHVASNENIADFCCTENVHVDRVKGTGCGQLAYWVFVEINSDFVLPPCFADELESRLVDALDSYRRHRRHGTANKVVVVQLKQGAFDKLRAHVLLTKPMTAPDQYKAPRLTRSDDSIKILLECAM